MGSRLMEVQPPAVSSITEDCNIPGQFHALRGGAVVATFKAPEDLRGKLGLTCMEREVTRDGWPGWCHIKWFWVWDEEHA